MQLAVASHLRAEPMQFAGSSLVTDEAAAVKEAKAAGFPVLLKATGGGGGIGIYTCRDEDEVCKQFAAAGRCAGAVEQELSR